MQRFFAILIAAIASVGIAFAQAPAKDAPKKAEPAKAAAPAAAPAKEAPKADAKKAELIDVNSASEKDLATLKGIGEVHAKAIVKGRPYKGKDDLVTKKIVTQKVYDDIKDQIIAKQK
jgi:DNA uptake protein ComE-like DNA-binding protein